MYEKPQLEIPEAVRQMAERNLEQARAAYNQFADSMRQAQDLISRSSGAMTESLLQLQQKTLRFAEENMEAGFAMAGELARARDLKEYFEIQSRHAQKQMRAYARQAQELGRMLAEAAQRAQPKG